MGVSTGSGLVSATRRTVGITDPKAPVVFEDVTARTALAAFRHRAGRHQSKDYIVETHLGRRRRLRLRQRRAARRLPPERLDHRRRCAGKEKPPRAALYRNLGELEVRGRDGQGGRRQRALGHGRRRRRLRQRRRRRHVSSATTASRASTAINGDGTFTDVAPEARRRAQRLVNRRDLRRLRRGRPPRSLRPRLRRLRPRQPAARALRTPASPAASAQNFCQFRGVPVMCGPRGLKGEHDTLYRQKPDGTFEDVVGESGRRATRTRYYGFSSAWVHANDDDLLDLIVVNDSTPKQLYINKGDGTFEEVGYPSGVALNENGREQAGMGLGVGDYDNDGPRRFLRHQLLRRLEHALSQRRRGQLHRRHLPGRARRADHPLPRLGHDLLRLRQRRLEGRLRRQRPRLPGRGQASSGARPTRSSCSSSATSRTRTRSRPRAARASSSASQPRPASGLAEAWPSRGLAVADLDADGRLDLVLNNIRRRADRAAQRLGRRRTTGCACDSSATPRSKSPRDATGAHRLRHDREAAPARRRHQRRRLLFAERPQPLLRPRRRNQS